MHSRVRCSSLAIDTLTVTLSLAVGVLLSKPDWAKDIVPNRRRMSAMRASLSAQENFNRRPSGSGPFIQQEDWAPRVVDDIDMEAYHCPDVHSARCVIL